MNIIKEYISRSIDILILIGITIFFSSYGFQDRSTSGWYQQWFPDLNGSAIKDITFLDSLTGYAVTSTNTSVQAYIIKTTNGGDNWNIIHTYLPPSTNSGFTRIQFENDRVGYASTNFFDFFKTTNSGTNWINISISTGAEDFCLVNSDTLFYVYSGFGGGVYRSTNGGYNWTRIWTGGVSQDPRKIKMINSNLGFACIDFQTSVSYRTTNGGLNWVNLNDSAFLDMDFIDSLKGWAGKMNNIKVTTNGGLNWEIQNVPRFYSNVCNSISIINKDTLWFSGCYNHNYLNDRLYGVLCKTTNGGVNWGYQTTDTSIHIPGYGKISFTNKLNGWAHLVSAGAGIHTKTGGNDSTLLTWGEISAKEIINYALFQNYPNPFNSSTVIGFRIPAFCIVKLSLYNILGEEICVLINHKVEPGSHTAEWNAEGYPAGVYFYRITAYDSNNNRAYAETKKMILVK